MFPNRFNVILEVYAFLLVNLEKISATKMMMLPRKKVTKKMKRISRTKNMMTSCTHAIKRRWQHQKLRETDFSLLFFTWMPPLRATPPHSIKLQTTITYTSSTPSVQLLTWRDKKYEEALTDAKLALHLKPEWAEAPSRIAAAHYALGNIFFKKAKACYVSADSYADNYQFSDALDQLSKYRWSPFEEAFKRGCGEGTE